ncbi:MAG: hypothetical protein N4A49_09890 [Marinifilaceae bacterium]|jgi:hypothetical protein|nr:hypothetical protein [Marinifilaceae bacterium]
MIKQDYLVRLIKEFFKVLAKFVQKLKDGKLSEQEKKESFDRLYIDHMKESRDYFIRNSYEDIFDKYYDENKEQFLANLEMLAELIYFDSNYNAEETIRLSMKKKSYKLYCYIQSESKDFSLKVNKRIIELKREVES